MNTVEQLNILMLETVVCFPDTYWRSMRNSEFVVLPYLCSVKRLRLAEEFGWPTEEIKIKAGERQ